MLRVDDVLASVFNGHARGGEAVLLVGLERLGERRVPTQGLEVQRLFLLESRVPGTRGAKGARRCRQGQSSCVQHLLSSLEP